MSSSEDGKSAKNKSTKDASDSKEGQQKIEEGSCHMCFHKGEETTVFYNPVQVQNRDLSVLMIALYAERRQLAANQAWEKKASKAAENAASKDESAKPSGPEKVELDILDALAASGLRSMRYWKECPNVRHITINDLDPAAAERCRFNIESNGLAGQLISDDQDKEDGLPVRIRGVRIQTADATSVMYNSRRPPYRGRPKDKNRCDDAAQHLQWDVIDLDPYGSSASFLDAAIQSIVDGGLLNVTCTDMIALGGSKPEVCFGRYGSVPVQRAGYLQEMAVRILLYTLATIAARYGRTIRPILSVGMDFYVRVFVEVYDNKAGVHELSLQIGHVYQSPWCPTFYVVPMGQRGGKNNNTYQCARLTHGTCTETGSNFKVAGPIWMGPMHDRKVIAEALRRLSSNGPGITPDMKFIATKERLRGLLTSCYEELPDVPLFYSIPDLFKTLSLSQQPRNELTNALMNAGYSVSAYHKEPNALKTNAPPIVVWDMIRHWAKRRLPTKPPKEGSAAAMIMSVEPTTDADYSMPKGIRQNIYKAEKITKFPMNPKANWGPMKKATGKRKADDEPQAKFGSVP
jgi:tRNA (guanine26-N2/guanine27-N2)-dimethyltransferase